MAQMLHETPSRLTPYLKLVGCAACLLMFSGAPPLAVAQDHSPGAAAERGQWTADREGTGGRMQTRQVSRPVLDGSPALLLSLTVTNPHFTVLRNELLRQDAVHQGGTYRYRFGLYVPPTFATSPLMVRVAQFHSRGQSRSAHHAGWGPPLALGIRQGRWQLSYTRAVAGERVSTHRDLGAVRRNHWTQFTVTVRWSPHRDGAVAVTKDGAPVLARRGPTMFPGESVPAFKWGLYTRRAWGLGEDAAPQDHFRIVLDGYAVTPVSQAEDDSHAD